MASNTPEIPKHRYKPSFTVSSINQVATTLQFTSLLPFVNGCGE
jgi:hypothetical protein